MWHRSRGRQSRPVELVLYSKPGCHLCEEMMSVVKRVTEEGKGISAAIREVDISRDPALSATYAEQIPVLFVNGRQAFKLRLTAQALRDRLAKERDSA